MVQSRSIFVGAPAVKFDRLVGSADGHFRTVRRYYFQIAPPAAASSAMGQEAHGFMAVHNARCSMRYLWRQSDDGGGEVPNVRSSLRAARRIRRTRAACVLLQ